MMIGLSRAKFESNHHHQQTNTQFSEAGCPSGRPTNSVKTLTGKISHSMDLLTPSSPGVSQLCLWPLIAPGYLGEGCHTFYQTSDASTPTVETTRPLNWYHMLQQDPIEITVNRNLLDRMQCKLEGETDQEQALRRGTCDQTTNFRIILEKVIERNQSPYRCFIGFTNAFDMVRHDQLWLTLLDMGCQPHSVKLVRNLHRQQTTRCC